MKEYTYNEISLSSFFIEKIKDDFIIISNGYENPFKYADELNNILYQYSCNKNATIYFDLLSYRGNRNRFIQTNFKNSKIDMTYSKNIEEACLPEHIIKAFGEFHSKNVDYILNNSNLSEYEKDLIKVA